MWKYWLVGGFVVALGVAWLPLGPVVRAVVPEMTADAMSGTVWRGRLRNAAFRGVALGDLDIGLDWRSLLRGDVRLDFERGTALIGRVGSDGGGQVIERLNGVVAIALPYRFAGAIDVELRDAAVSIDGAGVCRTATGAVSTRLTGIPVIGASPALAGRLRCDAGALHLPLASADGSLGLGVHIWADRRYRADLRVVTGSRLVDMGLAAAGFAAAPGGALLSVEGRL